MTDRLKKFTREYISEFVYGGTDGIISTFGVVATAAGAHLGSGVILIMGVASLIADGLSMGVGAYLSARSDADKTRKRKRLAHKQVHERQTAHKLSNDICKNMELLEAHFRQLPMQ